MRSQTFSGRHGLIEGGDVLPVGDDTGADLRLGGLPLVGVVHVAGGDRDLCDIFRGKNMVDILQHRAVGVSLSLLRNKITKLPQGQFPVSIRADEIL